MRVQFLGCGDAFASGGRLQTCFCLDGGEQPLLIDCGATALVGLKRERIDPGSIGWVALSHLHGDHFAGIPWLILDGQFSGRDQPLVIAGPPGASSCDGFQDRIAQTDVRLNRDYVTVAGRAAEQRLEQAGLRLAVLLDQLWDTPPQR